MHQSERRSSAAARCRLKRDASACGSKVGDTFKMGSIIASRVITASCRNFEMNGRKTVLQGGILRREVYAFKPVKGSRQKRH